MVPGPPSCRRSWGSATSSSGPEPSRRGPPSEPPPELAAVPRGEVAERRDARLDVVGRPLEDLLDLRLEAERDAPDDRVVGALDERDRRRLRRPRPSTAPAPSSSRGSADRPRASPGSWRPGIVRDGMLEARISITIPEPIRAPPRTTSPSDGRLNPMNRPIPPTMIASTPRRTQRAVALAGVSVNQPWPTTCSSSRLSKPPTSVPSFSSSLASMTPDPPPIERRRWSRNEVASSSGRARARLSRAISTGSSVAASWVWIDELRGATEEARLLGVELDQAAARRGRGWPSSGPGGSTSRRG